MLEIVDKNGKSAKFCQLYQSPSHPVPQKLFTEIDDFSPDFALGDLNLTVHGQKFTDWLNTENSISSQNIVDFNTFRSHRSREPTTTPDGIFPKVDVTLPPWSKQTRLVQVPKPDGSGKLRPISILIFLACIIDRLKQNRLDTLIHADPNLRNRYGFIRKCNCEDVVGALLDEVESDKKTKLLSCLIQLDLSSAYDLVSFANVIIALDIFLRRSNAHLTQLHLLFFVYDWCKNREILFENTSFCPANGLP